MRPLALICFCLTLPIICQSQTNRGIQVNGFASIVAGKLNKEEVDLARYGESWSMRSDTRLGAQVIAPLLPSLSVTGQVVLEGYSYGYREDYEPNLDLFFVAYQLNPTVRLRAGRLRTPFFVISEHYPVGYAYTWITPPREVYNPVTRSIDSVDGVDINVSRLLNGGDVAFGMVIGTNEGRTVTTENETDLLVALNIDYKRYGFAARYSFIRINGSQSLFAFEEFINPIYEGYAASLPSPANAALQQLADAHRRINAWNNYHAIGVKGFVGDFQIEAEVNYVEPNASGFSPEVVGSYLSASKVINDIEYYALLGHHKVTLNEGIRNAVINSYAFVPPGTDALLDSIRDISLSLDTATKVSMRTVSTGFRWDITDNLSFKYNLRYTMDHDDITVSSTTTDLLLHRISMDVFF